MPLPELNPLLNPVLSKNIGRWAEVYFTSPPEQREAAVQQLVRDLEREEPSRENEATPVHSLPPHQWNIRSAPASEIADGPGNNVFKSDVFSNNLSGNDRSTSDRSTNDPATSDLRNERSTHELSANDELSTNEMPEGEGLVCAACRYENQLRYRFCGRCGARLSAAAEEPARDFARAMPSLDPVIFRGISDFESTPSRRSYWPYLAAVLVLVFVGVGYLAWRGELWRGKTMSVPSQPQTQTAPAASESASTSTPSSASTPPVNGEPNSSPPAGARAADAPSRTEAPSTPEPSPRQQHAASTAQSVPVKFAPNTSPSLSATAGGEGEAQNPAVSLGGFEELSVARHYLSSSNGGEQSRSEAAQWLWKSVAKQNIDATVMLSDMYLRGDGVPKNCEQARLLLDAAAIKGRKDAAEQLRHLGAFGCQ
jgi:hypothetical protein